MELPPAKRDLISAREREVLELILSEYTMPEVARQLHISVNTAISHKRHLIEKLQVKNTVGLVRRAFECGILKITAFEAI